MIKTVTDIPNITRRGRNVADIDDFIASGQDLAEVELAGRDPVRVYSCFYQAVRRRNAPVHVRVRRGRVFLVREV